MYTIQALPAVAAPAPLPESQPPIGPPMELDSVLPLTYNLHSFPNSSFFYPEDGVTSSPDNHKFVPDYIMTA